MPYIAVATLMLSVGVASAAALTVKPSRSDCIAGFHMDWAQVKSDHVSVTNALDFPTGRQQVEDLAAMVLSEDLSTLYLQFKGNCSGKVQMSDRLIQFWRGQTSELPRFELFTEPVIPSPQTIDVKGSAWRD